MHKNKTFTIPHCKRSGWCVSVQLEGESFKKGNVVSHHFLVRKVKFVYDDRVNVVVTQQVI